MKLVIVPALAAFASLVTACMIPPQGAAPSDTSAQPVSEPAPAVPPTAAAPAGVIDPQLVGCWRHTHFESSQNGSSSLERTVQLTADGRYRASMYSSVSAGGMSAVDEDAQAGMWSADTATLWLAPDDDAAYHASLQIDGGIVYINGDKYFAC